jgi:hypothetical protein
MTQSERGDRYKVILKFYDFFLSCDKKCLKEAEKVILCLPWEIIFNIKKLLH